MSAIEVFVCNELCESPDAQAALALLPGCGGEILHVSPSVFEKLAFGHRTEGLLGVAEMPHVALDDLALPDNPLVAVVEGVEKPGNIGAVLRSADGAGVSAVIVADAAADLYNPNAIRTSLGTIFTVPVCENIFCTSVCLAARTRYENRRRAGRWLETLHGG